MAFYLADKPYRRRQNILFHLSHVASLSLQNDPVVSRITQSKAKPSPRTPLTPYHTIPTPMPRYANRSNPSLLSSDNQLDLFHYEACKSMLSSPTRIKSRPFIHVTSYTSASCYPGSTIDLEYRASRPIRQHPC